MASIEVTNLRAIYSVPDKEIENGIFGAGFRPVVALDRISFKLSDGDRVGVIGTNGSGKSTLLKVLSGIMPPRDGSVDVNGDTLALLDRGAGLIYRASLLENAKLKALSLGFSRVQSHEFALKSVKKAGLKDKLHDPLKSLSTGMAGRFNMAINSMAAREVMIMDEWVGTLDVTESGDDSLLVDISQRTKIFVLASHNETLIRELCNKVLLLDQGKLAYYGDDIDHAYQMLNPPAAKTEPDVNGQGPEELKEQEELEDESEVFPPTEVARKTADQVKRLVVLNLGRTGIPALRQFAQSAPESPGFKLIFSDRNKRICEVKEGEPLWLIYRDPIKRFVSAFYSRKIQGSPFFNLPYNVSELKIFSRYESPNQLAESLSCGDKSKAITAARDLSNLGFMRRSYAWTFVSASFLEARQADIVAVDGYDDFESIEERVAVIKGKLSDSAYLHDADEAQVLQFDCELSKLAASNLSEWFSIDYEVYGWLEKYRKSTLLEQRWKAWSNKL